MERKRIWRAGVRFDCPTCGRLWKDDKDHSPTFPHGCTKCGGDLRMVGQGASPQVGDANWYRCLSCKSLFMHRRGEVVPTGPRTGFAEFTEL